MNELPADAILERGYESLVRLTQEQMRAWRQETHSEIDRLDSTGRFEVKRQVTPEYMLLIRRNEQAEAIAQVGFPFGLVERDVSELSVDGYRLRLCLCGERIRSLQRAALGEILGFRSHDVTLPEFARICRHIVRGRQRCLYINPYSFLGDSFIGTYFRRVLLDATGLEPDGYYTRFPDDVRAIGDARPLEDAPAWVSPDHVVLLPDLIDTHFAYTLAVLPHLMAAGAPVFLIGRNSVIDPDTKAVHRVGGADPLLRDSNIEDYMDDCLAPFVPSEGTPQKEPGVWKARSERHVVFLNPFASQSVRDLSVDFVLELVEASEEAGVQRVFISRGALGVMKDRLSALEISVRLERRGGRCPVTMCQFENLGQMAELLRREQVTLGISADTSVPHLLNTVRIPAATFYNVDFWDAACVQSLSSDSPLGFCRYQAGHLPFLFNSKATPSREVIERVLREIFDDGGSSPGDGVVLKSYRQEIGYVTAVPENCADRAFDRLADLHATLAATYALGGSARLFDVKTFRSSLLGQAEGVPRRLIQSLFRVSPTYKLAMKRHGAPKR